MARSANDKAKAFHLFCMGVSYENIAKVVGCGERTVPRWIDKYGWRDDKERLAKVAEESGKNNKEKLNEELLASVKKVWAKSVQNSEAKASARDLIEVIKLERLVGGLSTENVRVESVDLCKKYKDFLGLKDDDELEEKE